MRTVEVRDPLQSSASRSLSHQQADRDGRSVAQGDGAVARCPRPHIGLNATIARRADSNVRRRVASFDPRTLSFVQIASCSRRDPLGALKAGVWSVIDGKGSTGAHLPLGATRTEVEMRPSLRTRPNAYCREPLRPCGPSPIFGGSTMRAHRRHSTICGRSRFDRGKYTNAASAHADPATAVNRRLGGVMAAEALAEPKLHASNSS
jgi:hypothetical protein